MIENHHGEDGEEYAVEYPEYGEGCLLQCDCSAECYREDRSGRQHCGDFGERVCMGGTARPGEPWVAVPSTPDPACLLLAG